MSHEDDLKAARAAIPGGWTMVIDPAPEPSGMPGFERKVGPYTISVGCDGGEWHWWVTEYTMADASGKVADSTTAIVEAVCAAADPVASSAAVKGAP